MTQLTNKYIGSVYGDYITTTNSGQGLPAVTPVSIQDGLGNNSPMTMSQTVVNFTRTGGSQFQLDGVALTASASSINSLPNITSIEFIVQTANASVPAAQSLGTLTTGLLKNTVLAGVGTLSTASAGVDYYGPNNPSIVLDNADSLYLGKTAGNNTNTGFHNIGVGNGSLESITTGNDNSALGRFTLFKLTTGGDNSGFGYLSLSNIITDSQNSAFGSGTFHTMTSGSSNSAFGFNAGSNQVQYNSCLFLGEQADASVNNLTNAVAIGANATVAESNAIVLGNGCNVGIGTSSPSSLLHVNSGNVFVNSGNITIKNGGFGIDTSSNLTVYTEVVDDGTTVGTGTLVFTIPSIANEAHIVFAYILGVSVGGDYVASTNEASYAALMNNPIVVLGTNPDFNLLQSAPGANVHWSSTLTPSPAILITVTGISGKTINWSAVIRSCILNT